MYPRHDYGTCWIVGKASKGEYLYDTKSGRVTRHLIWEGLDTFVAVDHPLPRKVQAAIKRIPQASEEAA